MIKNNSKKCDKDTIRRFRGLIANGSYDPAPFPY